MSHSREWGVGLSHLRLWMSYMAPVRPAMPTCHVTGVRLLGAWPAVVMIWQPQASRWRLDIIEVRLLQI